MCWVEPGYECRCGTACDCMCAIACPRIAPCSACRSAPVDEVRHASCCCCCSCCSWASCACCAACAGTAIPWGPACCAVYPLPRCCVLGGAGRICAELPLPLLPAACAPPADSALPELRIVRMSRRRVALAVTAFLRSACNLLTCSSLLATCRSSSCTYCFFRSRACCALTRFLSSLHATAGFDDALSACATCAQAVFDR